MGEYEADPLAAIRAKVPRLLRSRPEGLHLAKYSSYISASSQPYGLSTALIHSIHPLFLASQRYHLPSQTRQLLHILQRHNWSVIDSQDTNVLDLTTMRTSQICLWVTLVASLAMGIPGAVFLFDENYCGNSDDTDSCPGEGAGGPLFGVGLFLFVVASVGFCSTSRNHHGHNNTGGTPVNPEVAQRIRDQTAAALAGASQMDQQQRQWDRWANNTC